MEHGLIWLFCFCVGFALFSLERRLSGLRRDAMRIDRKLNAVLKHLNIGFEDSFGLSERVKELASDPMQKIQAIKALREETGLGLKDAKDAVEAYAGSLNR